MPSASQHVHLSWSSEMAETRTALRLACGAGIRANQTKSGADYRPISPAKIAAMAVQPQSVAKSEALWFLPSSYCAHDARQHEAQRLHGEFHMLVLDIDQGDLPLEAVRSILLKAIGPAAYMIYATKSASIANRKWRVLVPVETPISGQNYEQTASEFMQRMEGASQGSLVLDRAAARPGQVFYLPNRGEHYEFEIAKGEGLYEPPALQVPVAVVDQVQGVPQQRQAHKSTRSGAASPVKHFNENHDLVDLLLRYGYVRNGQSDHFRSPLQTSESFATRVYPDSKRWVSFSGSDAAGGLGQAKEGRVWGDAFDIYVHFEHAGNFQKAVAAWASYAGISQAEPKPPTVDLPAPATLDGSGLDYLEQILDKHRGEAAFVYAVALRLSLRVPHQWSPEDVRDFISGYGEPPIISAIMHRVGRFVDERKTAAMKPSRLGIAGAFTSVAGHQVFHERNQVEHLAPLPDHVLEKGGVFAIRAPMGSGKTQECPPSAPMEQFSMIA